MLGRCTTHFRTYFSGWIGIFTRGTIWILTHGHLWPERRPKGHGPKATLGILRGAAVAPAVARGNRSVQRQSHSGIRMHEKHVTPQERSGQNHIVYRDPYIILNIATCTWWCPFISVEPCFKRLQNVSFQGPCHLTRSQNQKPTPRIRFDTQSKPVM